VQLAGANARRGLTVGEALSRSMIPKKPGPDLMQVEHRLSEKIMLHQ